MDTLFHIKWGDGDNFYIIAPDEKTARAKMPDGRDMVNSVTRLDGLYSRIFKAGHRHGISEKNYLEGIATGRKEVVEWFFERGSSVETTGGAFVFIRSKEEWEAKKKEWEI